MEPDGAREQVEQLIERAFGPAEPTIAAMRDINEGRGAFSIVLRVELTWPESPAALHPVADRPRSVVAKLPIPGPNGVAAATSGAYRREAFAYREVLARTPVGHPRAWAVLDRDGLGDRDPDHDDPNGGRTCSLLLEDLTDRRRVDQLVGLQDEDAIAVARSLGRLHRAWDGQLTSLGTTIRRNTVAGLAPAGLDAGLVALDQRWSEDLGPTRRAAFARLRAASDAVAEGFRNQPATLCHGDPRADNLVFADDGEPILFDWQQMAIQFGEADLAWLAATSLDADVRRSIEAELVEAGGGTMDRYRLGLALPGLAVLFLAQRDLPNERARQFVSTSLQRIADAVIDNDPASVA